MLVWQTLIHYRAQERFAFADVMRKASCTGFKVALVRPQTSHKKTKNKKQKALERSLRGLTWCQCTSRSMLVGVSFWNLTGFFLPFPCPTFCQSHQRWSAKIEPTRTSGREECMGTLRALTLIDLNDGDSKRTPVVQWDLSFKLLKRIYLFYLFILNLFLVICCQSAETFTCDVQFGGPHISKASVCERHQCEHLYIII